MPDRFCLWLTFEENDDIFGFKQVRIKKKKKKFKHFFKLHTNKNLKKKKYALQ